MKYVSPICEMNAIETEDIMSGSELVAGTANTAPVWTTGTTGAIKNDDTHVTEIKDEQGNGTGYYDIQVGVDINALLGA